MASKLSVKAQQKMESLTEARRKWDRVHSLIEQAAAQKSGHDMYLQQIRRTAQDVSRVFLDNGLGPLADGANEMVLLSRRGGTLHSKLGAMREQVGVVRGGIERAERAVEAEEKGPVAG
jgi:hypothetical protein